MLNAKESILVFEEHLNDLALDPTQTLLIYDHHLEKSEIFLPFLSKISNRYPVKGGEALKSIRAFPEHLEKILELFSQRKLKLCGMGGGSISDFTGFVASILHRGVPFDLIPTTWLSAVDSAQGGKNALNVSHFKNPVGSFHFAERVFLARDLLLAEPMDRFQDALSEIIKIKIISGADFAIPSSCASAFHLLPVMIEEKMKIVRQDPYDQLRIRAKLNLGHTVGHAFEALYGLSHGASVALGLRFALQFSKTLNKIADPEADRIECFFESFPTRDSLHLLPLSQESFLKVLRQDKKRKDEKQVFFQWIEGIGKVRGENVELKIILQELSRQGWISEP